MGEAPVGHAQHDGGIPDWWWRFVARQVLFREDSTVDELIDVIEGNRKYIRCLYVYNKIDVMGMDDVDRLARQPNSVVISCSMNVSHALPLGQADAHA